MLKGGGEGNNKFWGSLILTRVLEVLAILEWGGGGGVVKRFNTILKKGGTKSFTLT